MQTIELKPNKKLFTIFIGGSMLFAVAITIYVFIVGNTLMKLLYVGLGIYLIYSLRRFLSRIKLNRAAVILTGDSISYYEKESEFTIKWMEIQDVILSTEDSTSYLTLKTAIEESKISISWLDKSPEKIKELVDEYRKNAVRKSIV